ncbi:ATP synthase subunit a-like 2, partial [Homarus americanus]
TLRNIIRPGTLAVRLVANIIAGHLLLTFLGNIGPSLSLTLVSFLMLAQILLLILESAVALIQSTRGHITLSWSFVQSERGKTKLIYGVYIYVKQKELVNGVISYECERRRHNNFKAKVKVCGNEVVG